MSSSTSTSTSSAAFQKLQTEFQDLKMRLNLNEDLTGLVVHSIKYNDDSSSVYNCVLNDCRGKAGGASLGPPFFPSKLNLTAFCLSYNSPHLQD